MIQRYSLIFLMMLALTGIRVQAQTLNEADLYKIDHPTVVPTTNNAQRSGEPGSDCAYALPIADGISFFLPTVNTILTNILTDPTGMYLPGICLGSAPNQTWFSCAVQDTGGATFIIQGNAD